LDHETRERPRKARNAFVASVSFALGVIQLFPNNRTDVAKDCLRHTLREGLILTFVSLQREAI
jgi:hypothetical protein